jgi:hypothetical protein
VNVKVLCFLKLINLCTLFVSLAKVRDHFRHLLRIKGLYKYKQVTKLYV